MQIAGNKCKVCGRNIVFSSEGKLCACCGTFVHLTCELRGICDVCGERFHQYERPKADPMREAILPPALRPAKSGGPLLAGLLILFTALLVGIAYYGLMALWASGH
jgi:hypothetical protein